MSTTKLTLFSLITKEIVLKFLTFFFLVRNIQAKKVQQVQEVSEVLVVSCE